MRSTQRTIAFDFEFQYPRAGYRDMANAITVCEPSFERWQPRSTLRTRPKFPQAPCPASASVFSARHPLRRTGRGTNNDSAGGRPFSPSGTDGYSQRLSVRPLPKAAEHCLAPRPLCQLDISA
jgi:hypothetical protein